MTYQKRRYGKAFITVMKRHVAAFSWVCRRLNKIFKSLSHTAFSYVIDYDRLSKEICPAELAQWIDHDQVAGCFQVDWIAEEIDVEELAKHIDMDDLAREIDLSDLSEYYEVSDIAEHIEPSDIAGHIDSYDLASYIEIDYSEIDIDLGDLAGYVDPDAIAESVSQDDDAMTQIANSISAKKVAEFVQDPWSMMVTPFNEEN